MENKTKKKESYRKRCETKPFHVYCVVKKSWCKRRNLPFDLTSEYLESVWTGYCPVFNIPLNIPLKEAKGRGSSHTAHLDRYDPSLGYIPTNVAWISGRANRIKYDASLEELKKIVLWMEGATTIPKGSRG